MTAINAIVELTGKAMAIASMVIRALTVKKSYAHTAAAGGMMMTTMSMRCEVGVYYDGVMQNGRHG